MKTLRWSYLGLGNLILLNPKKAKELLETRSKSQSMQIYENYKIKNIKFNCEKYSYRNMKLKILI